MNLLEAREEKRRNNIAVFAHYDKDDSIDEYVIFYLKQLKSICKYLIFVSDSNLQSSELQKIESIVDYSLSKKHGEYDFGSYKRGIEFARQKGLLQEADNLILCNDSCYGPFYPLEQTMDEMNSRACDFWGITKNVNIVERKAYPCKETNNKHVQSYFMVFKKQVLNSEAFKNFLESITAEAEKKSIIIKYEIGLCAQLCRAGFIFDTKFDKPIVYYNIADLSEKNTKLFIFMKKETLRQIYFTKLFNNWFCKIKNQSSYSIKLIKENFLRNRDIKNIKLITVKKCLLRLHLQERKIFVLGRWYDFSNANKELKNV